MVGAEQNTTDAIATHDVYSQGEFKDDQFQGHFHFPVGIKGTYIGMKPFSLATSGTVGVQMQTDNNGTIYAKTPVSDDVNGTPRFGTTTHGKQKAVYVYIKAVDGVDISDEDTFLDTVKNFVEEKNSYSTQETLTGGKWVDGKPIYRQMDDESITLKGKYEEDGDVTTIELTKMSIFGEDFSEYFTLKITINTDDSMPVASDDEITNIFTMTEEELTDLFGGLVGGKSEIPANEYYY
jgi:hypothetical protein